MPGLNALASGSRLLARRLVLGSRSSPAINPVYNKVRLGARHIATTPALNIEWEPQSARLVDRSPILDNRRVINNTHLIAQAQRLRTRVEKLEAKAAELKHEALRSEAEMLAILTENQKVMKWEQGTKESRVKDAKGAWKNPEKPVEGQWLELAKRIRLLAEVREHKYKSTASDDKKNEQIGLEEDAKDGKSVDLAKALCLLSNNIRASQGIVSETTEIHAMLHEGIQGFGKILDIEIQPLKVCRMLS